MVEGPSRGRRFLWASFIRVLVPCMRAPPSRSNQLPKALPPNATIMDIESQQTSFEGTQTFNPLHLMTQKPSPQGSLCLYHLGALNSQPFPLWSFYNTLRLKIGCRSLSILGSTNLSYLFTSLGFYLRNRGTHPLSVTPKPPAPWNLGEYLAISSWAPPLPVLLWV